MYISIQAISTISLIVSTKVTALTNLEPNLDLDAPRDLWIRRPAPRTSRDTCYRNTDSLSSSSPRWADTPLARPSLCSCACWCCRCMNLRANCNYTSYRYFKTLRFGICPIVEFYIWAILITVIAFPCAHTYFPQKINAKRYLLCSTTSYDQFKGSPYYSVSSTRRRLISSLYFAVRRATYRRLHIPSRSSCSAPSSRQGSTHTPRLSSTAHTAGRSRGHSYTLNVNVTMLHATYSW